MTATTDEWRQVSGFEGLYEVSSDGRVRRIWKTRPPSELKPYPAKRGGYLVVNLSKNGVTKLAKIHILVAKAFLGAPPSGCTDVRHMNGDKSNNLHSNLAWGTRAQNEADKIAHGKSNRGERHGMSKLSDEQVEEIRRLYKAGESPLAIASKFGVERSYPARIASGRRRSHGSSGSPG